MAVIKKPNYTQIPNIYFDEIMQTLSGSENLVFLVIMRKTFGWGKKRDKISYSQIMEMSGMAKSTVNSSLKALEEKGLIYTERGIQNVSYSIKMDEETGTKIEPVSKSNRYENRTGTGTKIEPVDEKTGTKIVHTKERDINKSKERYEAIENQYLESFARVLPNGTPILDYKRVRARIKSLLDRLDSDTLVQAIKDAESDSWIVCGGFAILTILSDYQLNKLINGKAQSSKQERDAKAKNPPSCTTSFDSFEVSGTSDTAFYAEMRDKLRKNLVDRE